MEMKYTYIIVENDSKFIALVYHLFFSVVPINGCFSVHDVFLLYSYDFPMILLEVALHLQQFFETFEILNPCKASVTVLEKCVQWK